MPWQKTFTLPKFGKGMHLITDIVLRECQEGLKNVDIGILYLHCLHTSAGLTINENCDPTVRSDMDMAMDHVVPESLNWEHTDEGPDAMETRMVGKRRFSRSRAHQLSKAELGVLALTAKAIAYLAEFRVSGSGWGGGGRKIVATILP